MTICNNCKNQIWKAVLTKEMWAAYLPEIWVADWRVNLDEEEGSSKILLI